MATHNKNNIFTSLSRTLLGDTVPEVFKKTNVYNMNDVVFSTNSKEEYDKKMQTFRQQKLLSYQWVKAGAEVAQESLAGLTNVKLMYRDADLMCSDTYIAAALEIVADETCCVNSKGKLLNIYSASERIKAILEDLFVNRLNINVWLPSIVYNMLKYGNEYMLLNINNELGITGWREIHPYNIERYEGEVAAPYALAQNVNTANGLKTDDVKFVWAGHNDSMPYQIWQMAHFRYLSDTFHLPYGTSYLHKARRAWRMLSMMEDGMLIYRLDKSIERRVFKIYVGQLNDADIPAYVQQIANNFKRTSIIDPTTGQVDLRKNFMSVDTDYFIPVRNESAPNPIETLSSAKYETAMDDIEYMRDKVLAALGVPKTFLNFQEAQGKGQNLSIMDIRFTRKINRIQQYVLMELNKIAIIHLSLLGFNDDLTNFTLTMNNPSPQIEAQELEDFSKRVQMAQSLLSDPGNGIQIYSLHRVLKEILKMSDKDIADNLNEIRLEAALAAELKKTEQIIKRTGIFDPIDNIYGETGADYQATNGGPGEDGFGGGGGGGFGAGLGGDDFDSAVDNLGSPSDTGADINGAEGTTSMSNAPAADAGTATMESKKNEKPLIVEKKNANLSLLDEYCKRLYKKNENIIREEYADKVDITSHNLMINETIQGLLDKLTDTFKNGTIND